jgi:hypothetical protein
MEKVYKIKHIPTEMFYQPDRENGNLSITGKINKFLLKYGLYRTKCRKENFKIIEFELYEKSN